MREGRHAAANKTVGAVLAYMSVLPHWAYAGSARRYWDYVINGKTSIGAGAGCDPQQMHIWLYASPHLISPHPTPPHAALARE